jgi:hypothetical protein
MSGDEIIKTAMRAYLQDFNSYKEFEIAYGNCNLNVDMRGNYECDFIDAAWHGFERCLVRLRKKLENSIIHYEYGRRDQKIKLAIWHPIDTCPRNTVVLFYREDAGVFYGQYSYCADWMTENERKEYDEDTLWTEDVWAYGIKGPFRCDEYLKPTHWMPLPSGPLSSQHPSLTQTESNNQRKDV